MNDKQLIKKIENDYKELKKYNATLSEFKEYNNNIIFENGIRCISQQRYENIQKYITMLQIIYISDTLISSALIDLKDMFAFFFIKSSFTNEKKSEKKLNFSYKIIDK